MSDVRDFGAAGDGQHDDTEALQHAFNDGDGHVVLGRGDYRITRTLEIDLDKVGRTGIEGSAGTAKILMAGPGPAIRLIGTHAGTGDPDSVQPNVWQKQRMPTLLNLEIEGAHPQADGIELIGTMQATLEGVLVHSVRNGIRLHRRNRNVLISHCHVYHNTGIGVFLDRVNLHQINIIGSHISYNRLGGIRLSGSEVRNLQITGNDIEYNNQRDLQEGHDPVAEIYIDTTADGASVDEVTVASNTIQATHSPGGANIRIIEKQDGSREPGLWTIAGNVIGSQENNVHLTGCHGVVLSGNFIYSSTKYNLLVENSRQINVGGNNFRRHYRTRGTGVRFVDSHDCLFHGCSIRDEDPAGQSSGISLLELERCQRITISGSQFLDGVPYGIDALNCRHLNISGCTFADTRDTKLATAHIRLEGPDGGHLLTGNLFGEGVKDVLGAKDS